MHGAVTAATLNTPTGIAGINSMITQQGNQSEASPNKPRAFINVIFFDEQFKTYEGGFKISMVGNSSTIKDHFTDLQNLIATKSGFVYIYCSNESPVEVFFDNLQVVHTRSPILEETHYYPFGLTMAGISSKALNGAPENKKKYQQYELNSDFDINLYETFFRSHDPQLGRFLQLDPKPRDYESPYAAMGNNPILNFDLLGDTTYRFNNSDGSYIGMFDLDVAGQVGSYGTTKTIGKGKNKQEVWNGTRFEFADPENDAQQIRDGIINQLVFVSDVEMKDMLTAQGAFNHEDKNNPFTFYSNSTGGQDFDYSFSVIPAKFGSKGASATPLDPSTPSRVLFLPGGDYTAHNHMNFGNYLWAASGYTLGFSYATLQIGGHINSLKNSKQNGYPSQWDSKDDQNSIKLGAYHASEYKYRIILELRHKAELQKQGGTKR